LMQLTQQQMRRQQYLQVQLIPYRVNYHHFTNLNPIKALQEAAEDSKNLDTFDNAAPITAASLAELSAASASLEMAAARKLPPPDLRQRKCMNRICSCGQIRDGIADSARGFNRPGRSRSKHPYGLAGTHIVHPEFAISISACSNVLSLLHRRERRGSKCQASRCWRLRQKIFQRSWTLRGTCDPTSTASKLTPYVQSTTTVHATEPVSHPSNIPAAALPSVRKSGHIFQV